MSNEDDKNEKIVKRPSKEVIDGFIGMQTSNIGDCLNKMGAINGSIHQINKQNLLGPAFTVKVPSGDNLMVFRAIEKAQPGDILVIDGEGSMEHALVGEILATAAQLKGLGGFVIDGCIRDYDVLSEMEIPIYAKGRTPNGPYRNGPGEINVPVSVGNKVVNPGDIIIGDGDGIVVVRPEYALEIQKKVRALEEKEKQILEKVIAAKGLDLENIYKKM